VCVCVLFLPLLANKRIHNSLQLVIISGTNNATFRSIASAENDEWKIAEEELNDAG